jgi:hypothetical protein
MKGVDFMQTKQAERENLSTRSSRFVEKIGSTRYSVTMFFPDTASETLEDKIFRLAKSDLTFQSGYAKMTSLQTARLPNGGSL